MSRAVKIAGLAAGGAAAALTLAVLVQPDTAHAQPLLEGIFGKDPSAINRNDIVRVLMRIIQFGLMFASAIAAVFIVVNGYQYVMSAGNPEKVEKAKMGLTWSIGGLVLVISAYAIVLLVSRALGFTLADQLEGVRPDAVPGGVAPILRSILNILFIFGGAVAMLFIVIGGYRYVTSQGNQELTEKAKKTLMYAIVGLALIFLSALIVNYVIGELNVTPQFTP